MTSRAGSTCLAVTALHVLQYENSTYLLSGAGCSLTIHQAKGTYHELQKQRIFECQSIHGIASRNLTDCGTNSTWIIIWGGRLVRFARVTNGNTTSSCAGITLDLEDPIDVGDWILDVCMDDTQSEAWFLTAHNNLYKLPIGATALTSDQILTAICNGPQTLLYSAKLLLSRPNHWIIASGTVFGEIVVWGFSQQADLSWKTQIRHTFLGHQGSVFGVSLSESFDWQGKSRRLLASCSDDRTIRIWNVSDCEEVLDESNNTMTALRDTGFGVEDDQVTHLAMAWGHLSRIWNVCFEFYPNASRDGVLGLLSRGEDGVCQLWKIRLGKLFGGDDTDTEILTAVSHDRHHAGKNVWSFAVASLDDQCRLFSGGADGQIVARNLSLAALKSECVTSVTFKNIFEAPLQELLSLSGPHAMPSSLKQYLILEKGDILATTDTGDVLLSNVHSIHQWSVIHPGRHGKTITMSANDGGNLVFFSEIDGSLLAYDVSSAQVICYTETLPAQVIWMEVVHVSNRSQDNSSVIYLVANMYRKVPQLLKLQHTDSGTQVKQCSINVPQGFLITSSFYHAGSKLLVCGSKTGALAMFRNSFEESTETRDPYIRWCVHGSDTVTSIIEVPSSHKHGTEDVLYIMSTGRDGTLSCHIITINTDSINLHTLHRSNPPIGQFIEGARFSLTSGGDYALIVHGFKSKEFVVWDESNQVWMMSVECGGAHRSWNYLSPSREDTRGDIFVWTKAGTFNTHRQKSWNHQIVQCGSHGREIKASALSPFSSASKEHYKDSRLVATGAEDTDIRLFSYTRDQTSCSHDMSSPVSGLKESQLPKPSILRGHTTGLQHLVFSLCGRFLFSSGGAEEFYVWRLQKVPLLEIGAVLIAKLQKNVDDLDARIMSFDVICTTQQDASIIEFTILLVYSNGKEKLVSFSYANEEDRTSTPAVRSDENVSLDVVFEQIAGTICLTQAHLFSYETSRLGLTGATDGALRLSRYSDQSAEIVLQRVHQSSIAATAVEDLKVGLSLIVTGGDDNALGITILSLKGDIEMPFVHTTLVPNAHAAALTAVATVNIHSDIAKHAVLVVSAGNDQKIRVWRVTMPKDQLLIESAGDSDAKIEQMMGAPELELLCEEWTDVADVSNVEVLENKSGESVLKDRSVLVVLVAGVGTQTLEMII